MIIGKNHTDQGIRIFGVSYDDRYCHNVEASSEIVDPGEAVEVLGELSLPVLSEEISGKIVVRYDTGIEDILSYSVMYPKPYVLSLLSLQWFDTREPQILRISLNKDAGVKYRGSRIDSGDFNLKVLKNDPSEVVLEVTPLTSSRTRDFLYIDLEYSDYSTSTENDPHIVKELFIPLTLEELAN